MKYAVLVWAGLWRRPLRTVLTTLSIVIAFMLFGLMQGVSSAFGSVTDRLRGDRLMTNNMSLLPLPYSYLSQLENLPGVSRVVQVSLLMAQYQNSDNTVIAFATDAQRLFEVYSDWSTSTEALQAMATSRTGAIVGSGIAKRFGWQIGDRVPLISSTFRTDGSTTWTFEIVGLYDAASRPGEAQGVIVNYQYLDEARAMDRGTVTQFIIRIDDADDAAIVSKAIDAIFESSPSPTQTQTEQQSVGSRISQIGNISYFVQLILVGVFFALLLLTANTMAGSVRERVPEFATLKALGFSDRHISSLVLAESALIFVAGATAGLLMAALVLERVTLPLLNPTISLPVLAAAAAMCAALATLSTAIPAWRAARLRIVDALRRL